MQELLDQPVGTGADGECKVPSECKQKAGMGLAESAKQRQWIQYSHLEGTRAGMRNCHLA